MTGVLRLRPWLLAIVGTWVTVAAAVSPPRFLPDDPLAVDPESHDASAVKPRKSASDMAAELLGRMEGFRPHRPERARNINTMDEVPDSSWFTNRAGLVAHERIEAAGTLPEPAASVGGPWTVVDGDRTARLPRLHTRDDSGASYVLTFDDPAYPELTTGASLVAARLLHAAGYNVPVHQLVSIRRDRLVIASGATVRDDFGRRRLMKDTDLDLVLARAARGESGSYRAVARREPDGVDLGPFSYAGTRADDPNDIFPHEHHRELRGLRVFATWLNHDAAAAFDTRDRLVDVAGRRVVRHYLTELGATLGSGTTLAERTLAGNEYQWRTRSKGRTIATLGFHVRPWQKLIYPDLPSVGLFEADAFDPATWVLPYSNVAFSNARPDDLFWGARRVASFDDATIGLAVRAGRYSDPAAETYLINTLIARRDKIARQWLNVVLPLVECQLLERRELECAYADGATHNDEGSRFEIQWYLFDNQADRLTPAGDVQPSTTTPRFAVPASLASAEMIAAEIRGTHPKYEQWATTPVTLYFRRTTSGWQTVGLERMP